MSTVSIKMERNNYSNDCWEVIAPFISGVKHAQRIRINQSNNIRQMKSATLRALRVFFSPPLSFSCSAEGGTPADLRPAPK